MRRGSSETRFSGILKPYDVLILKYLWQQNGEGVSSRDLWVHVNAKLDNEKTISPATILSSLNSMVLKGILEYNETPQKGLPMRFYMAKYNEAELKQHIAETILGNHE